MIQKKKVAVSRTTAQRKTWVVGTQDDMDCKRNIPLTLASLSLANVGHFLLCHSSGSETNNNAL